MVTRSMPRLYVRRKLCSAFWWEKLPSHQIFRSLSAAKYSSVFRFFACSCQASSCSIRSTMRLFLELPTLEQEYRSLQRLMEIAELRQKGIQDMHLLDWNFQVAENTPYVQMGKRYVNNWQQVKAENLGLLFWGDVGTGKSFLAACIANGLLDQGVSVMMTNFTRILNKLSDLQVKERCQYIASFGKVDLLIIDDLGVERNSEFALEQVYAVIDERYKANLPLIITTNLTPKQMRSVQDVAHARIYSRVLEMCTPILLQGADRRKSISNGKRVLAKQILFPQEEVQPNGKTK